MNTPLSAEEIAVKLTTALQPIMGGVAIDQADAIKEAVVHIAPLVDELNSKCKDCADYEKLFDAHWLETIRSVVDKNVAQDQHIGWLRDQMLAAQQERDDLRSANQALQVELGNVIHDRDESAKIIDSFIAASGATTLAEASARAQAAAARILAV